MFDIIAWQLNFASLDGFIMVTIPPLQRSWTRAWVYWSHAVCPSVYGRNRVRSVSTIPAGFIKHLINRLQTVCRVLLFLGKKIKIWIFGIFFICNFDFVFCLCNVNVKVSASSVFLLQPLQIFFDDTSRWLTKQKIRVWQITICYFWHVLQLWIFYLVFVVALKIIPDLTLYFSHFEWSENWHADVSWPPSELIRFCHGVWISSFCKFNFVSECSMTTFKTG